MDADKIMEAAVGAALPRVTETTLALCEQAMAKGLEAAADTMAALADDIIAGRAPVSDINAAAAYLRSVADNKRRKASKVLNKN